jgi:DNA repair exonuclease SbcCD nuclease subunit
MTVVIHQREIKSMNYDVNKLAVVGDLHFGIRNNSQQYLRYQSEWIENELKRITDKNKCDSVFFLGDVLDNRTSLSPLIMKEVRRLFKRLTETYKNVFVLLGNHDIYYRSSRDVHSLEFLEDQGVVLFENISEITFNDDKRCLILPWVTRDDELHVQDLLVNNKYDYCFGHLEINNFEMIKGVVERDGMRQDLFENVGKVYSGHFHLRRKSGNIDYVGTPYELDWGDIGEDKGVTVLTIKTNKEKFVKTEDAPVHIRIQSKNTKLEDLTPDIISDNFIQLKFHDGISEVERIDYIEKINSMKPISFSTDEGSSYTFGGDDESILESSIKDTMGFLTEYLDIIEIPEGLNKKEIIGRLEELYNDSL